MKIKANGITMNCELTGREGAPVVMLSHSLAATMGMWDLQLPVLTPGFRVLRYDIRGHGGTDAPAGPYTDDMLADDAQALLSALKIERTHFVGLSLGGMIGQKLAIRQAPAIASLALCATTSQIPAQAAPIWEERIRTAEQHGLSALADGTIDRWFSKDYQRREPDEVGRIRAMIVNTPVAGYVGCSHAIRVLNLTEPLAQVRLPTLIMVGREDPGTPVSASEEIHRHIRGSKLVVLDSAMHFVNIEQSRAFNEHLLDFLGR